MNSKPETQRISKTIWLMKIITVTAMRSTCPRLRVGAALVRKNQVLGLSYNGAPAGLPHCDDVGCELIDNHCIRATHAEINLLLGCARSGTPTDGTEIWVTQNPCTACSKAIIRAGVNTVYWGTTYGSSNGVKLLRQ